MNFSCESWSVIVFIEVKCLSAGELRENSVCLFDAVLSGVCFCIELGVSCITGLCLPVEEGEYFSGVVRVVD